MDFTYKEKQSLVPCPKLLKARDKEGAHFECRYSSRDFVDVTRHHLLIE